VRAVPEPRDDEAGQRHRDDRSDRDREQHEPERARAESSSASRTCGIRDAQLANAKPDRMKTAYTAAVARRRAREGTRASCLTAIVARVAATFGAGCASRRPRWGRECSGSTPPAARPRLPGACQ
jgi:hypothetical protein